MWCVSQKAVFIKCRAVNCKMMMTHSSILKYISGYVCELVFTVYWANL